MKTGPGYCAALAVIASGLQACAPHVVYVQPPPAEPAIVAPPAAAAGSWSASELRAASFICGSQDNWVTKLVGLRERGHDKSEATNWIGGELLDAFQQSEVDYQSDMGTLAITIAAGVVESVYTEPYGTVDEEIGSWESACFDWVAQVMAAG